MTPNLEPPKVDISSAFQPIIRKDASRKKYLRVQVPCDLPSQNVSEMVLASAIQPIAGKDAPSEGPNALNTLALQQGESEQLLEEQGCKHLELGTEASFDRIEKLEEEWQEAAPESLPEKLLREARQAVEQLLPEAAGGSRPEIAIETKEQLLVVEKIMMLATGGCKEVAAEPAEKLLREATEKLLELLHEHGIEASSDLVDKLEKLLELLHQHGVEASSDLEDKLEANSQQKDSQDNAKKLKPSWGPEGLLQEAAAVFLLGTLYCSVGLLS